MNLEDEENFIKFVVLDGNNHNMFGKHCPLQCAVIVLADAHSRKPACQPS